MATPIPPAAASDPLQKIKHVVVLMLENRSFDDLLGWLYDDEKPPRGQPFEGLHRGLWNGLDNIDEDGVPFVEKVPIRKNGEPPSNARRGTSAPPPNFTLPSPDPGEGYRTTNHQLFGSYTVALDYPPEPINMGFVNDYRNAMLFSTLTYGDRPTDPREIMISYTPAQVPVLSTLAKQFGVCDHWYASVPSQTLPNRHFVHAATSEGQVNNKPNGICHARTIYNAIEDAIAGGRQDLSWKLYVGSSQGRLFSLTRLLMPQIQAPAFDPHFVPMAQFHADAAAGTLPSYAFLEPQFHEPGANDQHPPADVRFGEQLIADVYNALVDSPQWPETLLVITYDEHGGCYDHVAPPNGATPPDPARPAGQDGFLFNRFGIRVPTVLVSPWIEAGSICRPPGRTPFDHTSVIATVRRVCGLAQPLTGRDKAAPDLGSCLTLATPRTDKPSVTPLPLPASQQAERMNDLHQVVSEIVEKMVGRPKPDEQTISDFVHEAYDQLFGRGQT